MFECEGDGLPAPNVTWYKDNSLLRDFKPNILVYPDGVLEINPVEFSDFGTYYCQVENTERARSSRLAKLAQNGNTGQGSSKLIGYHGHRECRKKDVYSFILVQKSHTFLGHCYLNFQVMHTNCKV